MQILENSGLFEELEEGDDGENQHQDINNNERAHDHYSCAMREWKHKFSWSRTARNLTLEFTCKTGAKNEEKECKRCLKLYKDKSAECEERKKQYKGIKSGNIEIPSCEGSGYSTH